MCFIDSKCVMASFSLSTFSETTNKPPTYYSILAECSVVLLVSYPTVTAPDHHQHQPASYLWWTPLLVLTLRLVRYGHDGNMEHHAPYCYHSSGPCH